MKREPPASTTELTPAPAQQSAEAVVSRLLRWQRPSTQQLWLLVGLVIVGVLVSLWFALSPAIIWLTAVCLALAAWLTLQQLRWRRLLKREAQHRLNMADIRQAYHQALTQELAIAKQLRNSQAEMEQKVAERTRELAASNQRLSTEIRLKDDYTEALQQNDQKLQLAMQASRLAVWDWDIPNRRLHVSGPDNAFGQHQSGQMLHLRDFVLAEDFPLVRRALVDHLKGRSSRLSVRYRNREQPPRWLEDTGRIIGYDQHNRPNRMLGTRRDISKEVAREQELTLAASLFKDNRDPLLVLDRDFQVSAMNPVFSELLRISPQQWQGKPWAQCSQSDLTHNIITRLSDQGHWEGELLEHRADGQAFPMYVSFRAVVANGQVSHYIGFCRDLNHHRPNRHVLAKGHFDDLTGLPNRSYFNQQVDYYRRMDQLPSQQVAIALLNVDCFHTINRQHGYTTGDLLLQDLAARLNQYGAPLMLVSRLGADEFGLLFSHFETTVKLRHLADQIIADIHRPMLLDDHEVLPSASMGLVVLTPENRHDCLTVATDALSRARRRGGNQMAHCGYLTRNQEQQRTTSLQVLQQILDSPETPLRFRPQVTLQGVINGIRVSTTLDYGDLGDVRTEPLYALAQEKQLEERLYGQLLRQACACFVRCTSRYHQRVLTLSFPLSNRLLFNERLREVTEDTIEAFGIAPAQLELCLSASALHHDRTLLGAQLNALSRAGFQLALEEVDAWPVVLQQLGQLPFGKLRVTQPTAAGWDADSQPLSLITELSQQLGWQCCVTQVNSHQQLNALQALAVDQVEGEQFAHALSTDELVTFVSHYQPTRQPDRLH